MKVISLLEPSSRSLVGNSSKSMPLNGLDRVVDLQNNYESLSTASIFASSQAVPSVRRIIHLLFNSCDSLYTKRNDQSMRSSEYIFVCLTLDCHYKAFLGVIYLNQALSIF